jgi:chemotaxis protein histidine kinase CheA/ActR/RegA family two-component response regulator
VRDDADLRDLFLEEARERLERVFDLVARVGSDEEAVVGLRRELHALKGASRMMGLGEISELCHRAEDLAEEGSTGSRHDLGECCRSIAARVEELSGGQVDVLAKAPPSDRPRSGTRRRRTTGEDLRVPAGVIDDLADRGARLRVIAVAAEGLADRLFRLATLAERGVGDRAPEQVLATLATSLRQVGLELEGGQRIFRRLTDRQLETLLHLQVQPIRPFVRSLADHARELAHSLGKKVEVAAQAGDAQLDRRISNALREAFLHLMRNAVDHGVESPEERRRSGKPETAKIRLEASTDGDRVRLVVRDDGRGIDTGSVVAAAVELGFITAAQAEGLSDREALQLPLLPGFSTRGEATQVSGRGVGLDAVAAAVRAVGGDVWLESQPGVGTTVTVEVPVARRSDRVLVLKAGEHQLALPAAPIQAFRRLPPDAIEEKDGRRTVRVRGQTIVPRFLSNPSDAGSSRSTVLVETVIGGVFVAIVADDVIGEEEVFIRSIPTAAGAPPEVEGITLLASGRPVAVLSLQRLGLSNEVEIVSRDAERRQVRPIRVLLVDDSDVTREMLRRLLEDAGIAVTSAGTADDALQDLEGRPIDCVVTDIEMPGMDGLGLTRAIREDMRFADLPIVVVSTLDRPADRLAGLEAGADAYLTKQGLDARELVALVYRVAGDG